jgi:hypothetical protein
VPLNQVVCLKDWDNLSKLTFTLDVTAEDKDRDIYIADLKCSGKIPIIFNPTHKIATVGKGKRVYVTGIKLTRSRACDKHYMFQYARRVSFKHLDLEEYDKNETHSRDGAHADDNGYKCQSANADPQYHTLMFSFVCIKSDDDIKYMFKHAIHGIVNRLQDVIDIISQTTYKETISIDIPDETPTIELILFNLALQFNPSINTFVKQHRLLIWNISTTDKSFISGIKRDIHDLSKQLSQLSL